MQDYDDEPPLLVDSNGEKSDLIDKSIAPDIGALKISRVPITIITGACYMNGHYCF